MAFGSVAITFRCAFLRGIECFLLQKNISNFAKATHEKRFTIMTPLDMSCDVTCHRLWRHNCFSNSIQFELIHFISIWASQNLLKIRTFLCIRKRNELFDHPSWATSWEDLFMPYVNNKGADQPARANNKDADQPVPPRSLNRVRCLDSLIPLLAIAEISRH